MHGAREKLDRRLKGASIATIGAMLLAGCFASTAGAATAGQGDGGRHQLATSVSPAAKAVSTSTGVRVSVSLNRDSGAMAALAKAISTPGSDSYHHFLSPKKVSTRFGATPAQRGAVQKWLTSAGLKVTHTEPFMLTATGSAKDAEDVIGAQIGAPSTSGTAARPTHYVARSRMSVPQGVAGVVSSVSLSPVSVAPLPTPLPRTKTSPGARTADGVSSAQPCSQYFGQKTDTADPPAYGSHVPYTGCWYSPSQVRSAYGFPKRLTGKGVTVATMGGEPLTGGQASIQRWSKAEGVPKLKSGQLTQIGLQSASDQPTPQYLDEWVGDLETVHGLAPDADLVYVWSNGSATGDPYADDLSRVVDNRLADVVSASLGDSADSDSILDPILQRAALEGITVNEASGDWGSPVDKTSDPNGYIRDTPWETIVGGTSLAIDKRGGYAWETPWADAQTTLNTSTDSWDPAAPGTASYYAEGGGGVMNTPEPWYQEGVADRNVVNGVAKRVGPDVAMEADCYVGGYPEGFYQPESANKASSTWYTRSFCGTSMASPMFAALEANVIQSRHGVRLGFLNPTLYGLYGSTAFHDVTDTPLGAGVTKGVVYTGPTSKTRYLFTMGQCATQNAHTVPDPLITPYCGTGFDQVTGVGSPAPGLFALLKK